MTMTTTDLHEIKTPHLSQDARNGLLEALSDALEGKTVEISVEYSKVTKTKARIEGEDYKGLLGISKNILIGTVKKVAKGKNGWYVLLDATVTRQPLNEAGEPTTEKLGWTSIKGEGIKALLGTRSESK